MNIVVIRFFLSREYKLHSILMFRLLKSWIYHVFFPPPVTWNDVCEIVNQLDQLDIQIKEIMKTQAAIHNLSDFIQSELDLQEKIKQYDQLIRRKKKAVQQARKNCKTSASKYEKLAV